MAVIIGVDPYKATHTAVSIDRNEAELGRARVRATRKQVPQLVRWAVSAAPPSSPSRSSTECSPDSQSSATSNATSCAPSAPAGTAPSALSAGPVPARPPPWPPPAPPGTPRPDHWQRRPSVLRWRPRHRPHPRPQPPPTWTARRLRPQRRPRDCPRAACGRPARGRHDHGRVRWHRHDRPAPRLLRPTPHRRQAPAVCSGGRARTCNNRLQRPAFYQLNYPRPGHHGTRSLEHRVA
jgi:hypothetical protein